MEKEKTTGKTQKKEEGGTFVGTKNRGVTVKREGLTEGKRNEEWRDEEKAEV